MLNHRIDSEFLSRADENGREIMKKRLMEKHGFTDVRVIGRSILSRPIEALFIGDGKKYVTVLATHHALESISANVAFLLADTLLAHRESRMIKNVNCKLLLSKYCFVIVPCVNPDGVELRFNGACDSILSGRQIRMSGGDFSTWQANARGVDLNHNYDYRFFEYKRLEEERGIYAGPTLFSGEYPESEPETRSVANLIRVLSPIAIVSLHSQGEEIYAYPDTPSVGRCSSRLSTLSGYARARAEGTAAYGGLCDYTGSLGTPSFTYELGRGTNPLDESQVPRIFARVAESILLLPTFL